MASVLQQYHQLADRMATQITSSYQSWTDFLTTAARLYKYPYHEQLMIYAQRPDATACAEYDLWNKRMGRYIRQGAKGIALIDHSGDAPRLRYVFDVADTRGTERSRSPYLWEFRPEHERVVSHALEQQYSIRYAGDFADQLEQICSVKVTEYFLAHEQDILGIVDGSYAIWDDEADGYYVDADGVAEEFTSEWQAEEYRLKLQEQVLMERAKGLISDFCQSEYGSAPDFSDPAKIGIAYTTITDDEIPIQVNIDLVKFRLERDLNGEHLETRQYSSLQDLIANELEILDFSDLVHVSDEDIEQYRWHNREEATEKALETVESVSLPQENKALYSVGDTVYLDNKPFEITEVGLFDVHLRDPSQAYPVFRAESKERLEVLLRQDERNAHLFAVKPPAMGEEEKLILEHEGQAALSEMGELIPDPDDAISQAEPDEPPAHSPAVSILIDGQWQEFPSASAAEKASYADFKAASHREAQNFRITDDDLGAGGAKAKFQANLNAIQLLKHLEAEGLQASPEQQQVLSRYVGWGGLPDAFDASKPSWASEYQALKAAFTPEEYTAARASTLNAHYTSPTVIRAIYEAVGNMGFQTGNILEPSMGIGNFFGMLPENMRGSRLYGVELDSITGRIAKQLYPKANITIAGFETTDRRDFFDLAVGKVIFCGRCGHQGFL